MQTQHAHLQQHTRLDQLRTIGGKALKEAGLKVDGKEGGLAGVDGLQL